MSDPMRDRHTAALELTEIRRRADGSMLAALLGGAALAVGEGVVFQQLALALACAAALCTAGAAVYGLARGTVVSRSVFPVLLMGMVALHIQLAGGKVEYHFGVFVTLAFLLLYRDWMPLLVGAATIAVHHVAFDRLQALGFPVYCTTEPDLARVMLHAGYVVVQTGFEIVIGMRMRADTVQAHELHQLVGHLQQGHKLALDPQGPAQSPAAGMLSSALQRIASAIGQVDNAASAVGAAAQQMAAGQQEVSRRTVTAASRLQETAASTEQLTRSVQESARSAKLASELTASANDAATRGGAVVSQVIGNMQSISESSRQIADIIGVIDGIAFQTNLLALNAAVEAARAGTQGRGFAVVAGEVRTLAQRSAAAAREIKSLIGASSQHVEAGTRLVEGAATTMDEIVSSVQRVSSIMRELNEGAALQAQRIETVAASITQLDQMTQQNADFVTQSSQASHSLQEQAARLSEVVDVFMLRPARAVS
jgi:methyl-accepting chemotaxis protein